MATETVKQLFVNAINKGMKSAEGISDAGTRANAYASLAQAMALSGLIASKETVSDTTDKDTVPEKETPAKEPAKTPDKKAPVPAPKGKAALGAPAKDTPKKEEKEPELTEEWTDEMQELFKEEGEKLGAYIEQFGKDTIEGCVAEFSNGSFDPSLENITPLNIKAFIFYLDQLAADAAAGK